ncbi:MAG: hypothetical protein HWE21_17990 [Cytophagia bacterium]|nr:hypothetical protein [Cytophagia bacterium]
MSELGKGAEGFFKYVAEHPKLFWGANNTGCEAKTDLVAELASERGFETAKIWIRPQSATDSFLVYMNEAGTEYTAWNYHVATELKIQKDTTETLIIDPTIFDKPVHMDIWYERLSRLSRQYNVVLEVKRSRREAFFGPEDFLTSSNREKALLKREKILMNAANLDDPIILDGIMMKLRGAFVDILMKSEPERFNELRVMLRNEAFAIWFKKPIPVKKLNSQLTKNTFFGIDADLIKNSINLSEAFASVELKEKFWEPIGIAFKKLTQRSEEILNGRFTRETMTFKIDWEDKFFRRSWYSPNSEEIWNNYGLTVKDLQYEA